MTTNHPPAAAGPRPWSRPELARTRPNRNAGGFYRTADRKVPAAEEGAPDEAVGGIPLQSANAAVVAAVRLAYRVAEKQIDRSTRMARRLREAGDRQAGGRSDEAALDATERLVQKALLSGLEWWEGSVAEGRCPVKRLVAAEYQMMGSLLGLAPAQQEDKQVAPEHARPPPAAARPGRPPRRLLVVHQGAKSERRPVAVEDWEIAAADKVDKEVYFFSTTRDGGPLPATVEVPAGQGDVRLRIRTRPDAAAGRWRCAVCDEDGVQVGFIEISL